MRPDAILAKIEHRPWPLQRAEADIEVDTTLKGHGLTVEEQDPLLHFVRRIDTVVWPVTSVQ